MPGYALGPKYGRVLNMQVLRNIWDVSEYASTEFGIYLGF